MLESVTIEEFNRYPVFRLLDVHTGDRIRQLLRPAVYSNGATIIREGDDGDALFLVRRGQVEVVKRLAAGGEDVLAVLPEMSLFGEVDFLLGKKRSASIRARGQVEVLVLPRSSFYELLLKRHLGPYQIIHYIAIILAERLQETNKRLGQILKSYDEKGGIQADQLHQVVDTMKEGFSFLDQINLEDSMILENLLEESLPGTPLHEDDPTGELH